MKLRMKLRAKFIRGARIFKAALFTILLHCALIALLFYGFNWTTYEPQSGAQPIQAVAIDEQEIIAAAEERRKIEEQKKAAAAAEARRLEELKRQREAEQKKLAELEKQRKAEERKQKALAEQRRAAEKKRQAAEAKRKAEEEKRAEQERLRKLAEEKKRKAEEERKRKAAEEAKRKAEEQRKREAAEQQKRAEQLRERLAQEQREKTRAAAVGALTELQEQIRLAVKRKWQRPAGSDGLTAEVEVHVAVGGLVRAVRIVRSSGNAFFDRSVENAVHLASPLPFPTEPKFYEFIGKFNIKFKADEN